MTDAREAELLAQNARLEKENALLRQKLDLLIRKLFGAQSEKLDPAQLLLLLQGFDDGPKAPEPVGLEEPRRSREASPPRERRPRLPEHLPVVVEFLDPLPVQACPAAWRCLGEEVSAQLDYEPAEVAEGTREAGGRASRAFCAAASSGASMSAGVQSMPCR